MEISKETCAWVPSKNKINKTYDSGCGHIWENKFEYFRFCPQCGGEIKWKKWMKKEDGFF